jgi:hypothetical protein
MQQDWSAIFSVGLGCELHVHQVVPAVGEGTYFVITGEPVETMQIQATGAVDILRSQSCTTATVKQHQRAPVLFGIGALHLAQKFDSLVGHMFVLNTKQGILIIA